MPALPGVDSRLLKSKIKIRFLWPFLRPYKPDFISQHHYKFTCIFITDKVLVTTGNPVGNGQKTEIIDLSKPNQKSIVKSEVLPDSPGPRGPVGGLVEDQAVICGGSINTDELQHCIILGQPNKKIQMIEKRAYASR